MYLTQGLKRTLQQNPNGIATICAGREHSFRELGNRVAKFAGALRQLGMQPGDRVAMLSLNSDRYLEYFLGTWWAGGVVNAANTRWSAAEIIYSLKDSGSSLILVDDAFKQMAATFPGQIPSLRAMIYTGNGATPEGMRSYEELLAQADPIEDACGTGNDLAGIFYTGGTTGTPKGVMLSQANLWSSGMSFLAENIVPSGSVFLHAAPMFHLANGAMMTAQLLRGGRHVFIPGFAPVAVLEAIKTHKVTDMLLVPTMIQMLVDHPTFKDYDTSSVCRMLYGASPIAEAVLGRAMAAFPKTNFFHAYGMTELSPLATLLPSWYHTPEGRKTGKLRSVGRASYCVEAKIVDTEGNEVPRGTVGEVAVRGPNVMLGYWNKPKETAAAVRNGWMHTGDGATMDDDGFIYIVDRIKDMIITGGENVYSAEVENAIAQHPAVATAAVIGIPNDRWGEMVHAVVILKSGATVTADALIAHCKTLIAGYKCPRSIEFREQLPLSGAGKVLKTVLREPFWKGRARAVS